MKPNNNYKRHVLQSLHAGQYRHKALSRPSAPPPTTPMQNVIKLSSPTNSSS